MLGQLIDVVQGTLPAALVVTVLLVAIRATEPRLGRWVGGGLLAGAAAAVVLAVLRETTVLVNRELVALVVLVPLLLCELGVVVLLWRRSGPDRTGPAPRVAAAIVATCVALLVFRDLPAVLLQTGGFVAPGKSAVSTDVVLTVLGYVLGFVAVLVTCWAVYRGSGSATPRPAVAALTAVVLLRALAQLVTIVQILLARGLVDVPRWGFRTVVWVLNHDVWLLCGVLAVALALPAVALVSDVRGRARLADPAGFANPAEHRAARAEVLSRRRFCGVAVLGAATAVLAVTVGRSIDNRVPVLSPPEPFTVEGGSALVRIDRVADGHLHRFAYEAADGTEVRFIVIRKNASAYGVALDACEVCGSTGYYERGGAVVCKLCDVVMNIQTIGFKGGCNPIPLEHTIADGRIRVQVADLEEAAGAFA